MSIVITDASNVIFLVSLVYLYKHSESWSELRFQVGKSESQVENKRFKYYIVLCICM